MAPDLRSTRMTSANSSWKITETAPDKQAQPVRSLMILFTIGSCRAAISFAEMSRGTKTLKLDCVLPFSKCNLATRVSIYVLCLFWERATIFKRGLYKFNRKLLPKNDIIVH